MNAKTLRMMAGQLETTSKALLALADSQESIESKITRVVGDATMLNSLRAMRRSAGLSASERSLIVRITKKVAMSGMTTWQELAEWQPQTFMLLKNYGEKSHGKLREIAREHGVEVKPWGWNS